MIENVKEQILNSTSFESIDKIETEIINEYRNNFYNEILKDDKIKKHLSNVFGVKEELLENVLMINDCPPLDFIDEDDSE